MKKFDITGFRSQQMEIKKKIITHNVPGDLLSKINVIAGVDISWINETGTCTNNRGVAAIAVLEYPHMKMICSEVNIFSTEIPYINGYLGFREMPQYVKLWEKIIKKDIYPDIILVDGFGILHPIGCGSSSMLGVELDVPTIGVGKNINLAGCDKNDKDIKKQLINEKLLQLPLLKNDKIVGTAIRKNIEHKQPVYVSIGHKISLLGAVEVIKKCMIYKIPEPIRQADIISRNYIRKNNLRSPT